MGGEEGSGRFPRTSLGTLVVDEGDVLKVFEMESRQSPSPAHRNTGG